MSRRPKRTLSPEKHEETRRELRMKPGDEHAPPPVRKVMKCGHEDVVGVGVDPTTRNCWLCGEPGYMGWGTKRDPK
jgi:hypothetical protein